MAKPPYDLDLTPLDGHRLYHEQKGSSCPNVYVRNVPKIGTWPIVALPKPCSMCRERCRKLIVSLFHLDGKSLR